MSIILTLFIIYAVIMSIFYFLAKFMEDDNYCKACGSKKLERGFRGEKNCRNKKCTDKDNYYMIYKRKEPNA